MANLAELSNSITDFVKGVGAELGIIPDNSGNLYPVAFEEVTSSLNLESWNRLVFPYTFSVVDIVNRGSLVGFKDFSLPIAPSKLSQTEQFAISIKPTQGGTVVNHSGNRYKKLTIEGTTGVNPFRGMTGVDSTTGRAIAKDPGAIKYKSGYEVFIELRNWFKVYYQVKATFPDESRDQRMVFKNFKDGEFLIVELLDFTMDRTASRSLLYDYKMEFKVLSTFNFDAPVKSFLGDIDSRINKAVSKIDTARGIFLGTQEILRKIESSYNSTVLEPLRKINLAAKALAGIPITAADVGNRIVNNTVTSLDSLNIMKTIKEQQELAKTGQDATVPQSLSDAPLPEDLEAAASNNGAQNIIDLNEALLDIPVAQLPASTQESMPAEIEDASNNPRSFYEEAIDNLTRVKENAEDSFNLGSDTFDQLFDRTATFVAESGKEATPEEFSLLGAFNESITGIHLLLSSDVLFKSEFASRIETIEEQFVDDLNLRSLPTVKQINIPIDVDLEQIALDELGDPTRWVEIAELNDLNAPYIVQDLTDTRSNIKHPGDDLLVPQNIKVGLSEAPRTKEIPSTVGLSEVEKSLGTDLKLTKDQDLDLANNGDLAVISGAENMAQAIILKLGYEKGELKNHPVLGVGLIVGKKFLSLENIRDNMLSTLTQDPRIESISDVALLRDGPALFMSFLVHIKQVDTPIPLKVKL